MFKFIHAADIHLDSPQRGLDQYEGAPVEECRQATRRALENLVRLAIEERVAFVLIVGDLYDGDWPDYNTGLFFGQQMARLRDARIPVYLIQGNHDAANKMTRHLRPPDNVRFLDTSRPETVTLDDVGVALHGQGYERRDVTRNLAEAYPRGEPSLFNIGLLHTCVDGREGHDRYAPCSLNDMKFKEYQYWALGHIHQAEFLSQADPVIAFPGNLQGRNVREHGPKGCLLITVDNAHKVSIEERRLDVVRWRTCRLDVSGTRDGDELIERFRNALDTEITRADDRLLALRVELHGACPAHALLSSNWPRWINEIRQAATDLGDGRVWVEKVLPRTEPAAAPFAITDGPLGELVTYLDELRQNDAQLAELASGTLEDLRAKLPSELLDGLPQPDRLRELLDQIGPMLLSRLTEV